MKTVTAEGGKILAAMNEAGEQGIETMMIPRVGLWISVQDNEGNHVSILQPTGGM